MRFWLYFSGMAIFILVLLWLLQIVFINSFYQTIKIRQTEEIGRTVSASFGTPNFEGTVLRESFRQNASVQVYNEEGILVFPLNPLDYIFQPMVDKGDFERYFRPLTQENTKEFTYVSPYEGTENSAILYVTYLGEEAGHKFYLSVSSILDPVDSTVEILKNQLVIISIISLILAFVLSYFLSRRLAKPLSNMAKTARQLGRGDYDVTFDTRGYTEVHDLAQTLNYATGELTKTIELRKDLIANVSHDLKTPLTLIKSYGEMIRDISGDLPELRERHIQTILEEADYLTGFVNDLLDLSRVESGISALELEEVDLEALTRETLSRFAHLEEEGYEFVIHLKGSPMAICDASKIRQVIYNFISNGVNYSHNQKRLDIHITEEEDGVALSVQDYGIGISQEHLEGIWERYYRASANYKRSDVGTGLGLSICKNILELHGFPYGVNSVEGEGSTFYFVATKANPQ